MGKIYRRNGVWYGTADDMIARIAALEARVAAADALADTLAYIRDGKKLNVIHMRRAAAVALAAYESTKEQDQ